MGVRKLLQEDSAVSFKVFFSVVAFLVTVMATTTGYFFEQSSQMEAKVTQAEKDCRERTLQVNKHFDDHVYELNLQNQTINLKLAEIQTDIGWIRRALNNEIQTSSTPRRRFDK